MNLDDIPEYQEAKKRARSQPQKKKYLTPGHGYEEDKDVLLEGRECKCGGTLQLQRRHQECGTRISRMIGGPGKYPEVTYKRVDTVVCSTCKTVYDSGIYKAWLLEQRRLHPFVFLPDQHEALTEDEAPSDRVDRRRTRARRKTDNDERLGACIR